jgi:hypothetical protein
MSATYTRNELQRKLAKAQRELPTAATPKNRAFLTRKAKKYVNLLANMNRMNAATNAVTTASNPIAQLDAAVASYYEGEHLSQPQLTPIKHTGFETTFNNAAAAGYKIIQTSGDGDCLIHAILTALSPSYQKIPYAERSAVGGAVRRNYLADKVDPEMRQFFLSRQYLLGEHLEELTRILQFNFIIFQEVPKGGYGTNSIAAVSNNNDSDYILIHNRITPGGGGDHYSAVRDPQGRMTIPYVEGQVLEQLLSPKLNTGRSCDIENDGVVLYNGEPFIVEERYWTDTEPFTCVSFKLKQLDTGAILKGIPKAEVSVMGGGQRQRKRKHRKTRKNRRTH